MKSTVFEKHLSPPAQKDQAIAQSNFPKVPATLQDTANAAVLVASDRGRMLTGTVINATAGAALD